MKCEQSLFKPYSSSLTRNMTGFCIVLWRVWTNISHTFTGTWPHLGGVRQHQIRHKQDKLTTHTNIRLLTIFDEFENTSTAWLFTTWSNHKVMKKITPDAQVRKKSSVPATSLLCDSASGLAVLANQSGSLASRLGTVDRLNLLRRKWEPRYHEFVLCGVASEEFTPGLSELLELGANQKIVFWGNGIHRPDCMAITRTTSGTVAYIRIRR